MSEPDHYVTIHALEAGWFTMPERFFVAPLEDKESRKTVPSLSFLIQHVDRSTGTTSRIVFDLGLRREIEHYSEAILSHIATRKPLSTVPDVVASLGWGDLAPDDIDAVVLSHLHWDHIGTPKDFETSKFVIGAGGLSLLKGSQGAGTHNKFEPDLLPLQRTVEVPSPEDNTTGEAAPGLDGRQGQTTWRNSLNTLPWKEKGPFPHTLDVFQDGSVFLVWAPGHLVGHLNMLCRKKDGGYVYLGGDAAHDMRLISGDKDIATWKEQSGQVCCIHQDPSIARETMSRIRKAKEGETPLGFVEVVLAHDGQWAHQAKERGRFFPGSL